MNFLNKDELLYKGQKNIWYILFLIVFLDWIFFYDRNSFSNSFGLDNEIERLQKQRDFLKKEIEKDRQSLENLKSLGGKEKFGRENYYLKRDNEDIYIIEYDTIR